MNQRPANHRLMEAVKTICASRAGLSVPAVALLGFNIVSVALADPTGGVVVGGQATISTPAAGRTVIDQTSQHLQVNWNTFDVGANESVRFNQPSSSSVALNRILDQNPSQIFGSIEANGQVILVNPNGMLFGHSAQLNVGSLVASSLDVIGFDAATGRYSFGTSRSDVGAIVNDGTITAARGGSVTLLGGRVTNNGSILADFGTVNLAAGRAATLDLAGDGLLRLEVDGELFSNSDGASAAVANSGVIEANGGQVLLTAQAIDGVFANLVNNTGVVRANRIDNSGGTIRLIGAGGTVRSSGVLDASAGDAVSSGGRVEVLGEQVGLFDAAVVDVSGATNGGTALIGGDFQGKNPDVLNAARTYVSTDATIRADAGSSGDGGRVIVWADEITRFNGSISARGGSVSGDGGFAEVSGKNHLVFQGAVDLSAPRGNIGTLLLDPTDITITDSPDTDPDFEDDGTYAFADEAGPATIGNATIEAQLAITNVVLQATNSIVQDADADIDVSGVAGASGRSLTLEAGGSIELSGTIRMNNGAVTLIADSVGAGASDGIGEITMADGSSIHAGTAAVSLAAAEDIRVTTIEAAGGVTVASSDGAITMADGSSIDADAGAVSLTAVNDVRVTSITATGAVTVTSSDGAITMADGSSIDADADAVSLTAANDIRVTSITTTGAVTVTSSDGAIVNDSDDTTLISGGTVTLSGEAIGSLADRIDTDATSISATASNGGVFITEADALNLTADATNGAVNVRTVSGALTVNDVTGDEVTLAAGGDGSGITLNGEVNAGTGNVTLTAGSPASRGAIVAGVGGQVIGAEFTATGSSIGSSGARLSTSVSSLNATATDGSIFVTEANGLRLSNVSAAGTGSDVDVTSTTGNIQVETVTATDAVTLTATEGSIIDDGTDTTRISAETLTLSAGASIGGAAGSDEIDTNVASLTATAGTGGVYIGELNGLTSTTITASNAGADVRLTSTTGNITVNSVTAADEVTLIATAGSIFDDNANATRISAQSLTLSAGAAIGSNTATGQIDTSVASLSATANGGIYIGELDGLTLTNVIANTGGSDVEVTSTTGDIWVDTVTAADAVTLTATAGSIIDDGIDTTRINAQSLTLSAGTAIGGAAGSDQIDTNVTSLTATAGTGGIYIGELNGLTLTSVVANGAGSDISVTSTTGDIEVNTVSAADAVTLTTAGSITDDGSDTTRINAQSSTLSAETAIGSGVGSGQIDTNVASLTATALAGGVYIGELNGLELTSINAVGGDVNVSSTTGDIVAGSVNATNNVTLTATAGAITDDDNDATRINGFNVSLSAATNIGTVVNFDAADDLDVGSSVDVQLLGALTATVASNTGSINLNISGQPDVAAGGITLGSGSNRAGAIVLQSTGNLNLVGLMPGAINIGSANTTSVGLRAGSMLTLPVGEFTDQPADRLLVSGAFDVLNGFNGHELTFAARELDFRAGGGDGAVTLNTDVDQLSASVGNNQNLTVNEADSLTIGTLDVGGGNITLSAGGAVADDGQDTTRIVANVASLSAASLGGAGNALDTQVNTLSASTTSGGVYINEANALALTVNATGGAADVRTTNGSLTVSSASGTGVTLVAGGAGNGITANGAVNSGAGNVTMTAGGAIVLNDTLQTSGGDVALTTTDGAIAQNGAISTGGGDVTMTAGGAGNGVTLNNTVNAGAGDVTLTAGTAANRGAIVAGLGSQIIGGSLTATGSVIGTGAARLSTAVNTLNATSTNGGIFITEADALTLSANATGGAVDVNTTNGALTATSVTGNGVTLVAGGDGSGITLNGAVNAGAGDVALTAGTVASRGAIVAGAANQITGGSLTATASSIGTAAARLNTTVNSLSATSTNGGIFVTEANALTLTADATNGAVDVRTTNGALTATSVTGSGVTLVAGGAGNGITLNGALNAGSGDVTLTAGGAIVAGAANQITGNSLTATGSSIGTVATRLNTTVSSLNATSTNGGIFVTETDALTLTANATNGAVDVRTTNGAITATSVAGNGVTLTADGAGNGITINGTINGGAGDVTLTAGTAASRGAIVANAAAQIAGNSLTAIGSAIGTSAARLNTAVAALDATSTNGGIFITEADALNLTANATNGAVDVRATNGALTATSATGSGVTLAAGGAGNGITLSGALNAGSGDVTLTAGGAIVAGAAGQITGNSLTATGSSIGTAATRLNTTVSSLNATSTNGGIFINESDALTLTASATGGSVDVQSNNGALNVAAVSGNGVVLTAGGAGSGITLNGALNAGGGDVVLTAGTNANRGAIAGAAGHSISGRSLTATASSIGANNARLNTNIDSLIAAASTGGVHITEQNGLTLANVSAASDVAVSGTAGDIVVSSVDAGGNVTLAASGGAIADDGDDSTRLSGNALSLTARSIGAASTLTGTVLNSSGRLDTEVTTLNATATAGGIFIDEADGLQSVSLQASGGAAGDIELLTLAGDLILQQVSASDTLLLAAGRNLLTAPGASAIKARAAELRAGTTDPAGGRIGTITDSIDLQLSAGNSLRLFVPQTIDPNDPDRAPATLPSAGVTSTVTLFGLQGTLAARAGFNQFQGLGETQFTSPAETLVRSLQSQTGTVQAGLDIDWVSFDPEVSLFGTLEPSVCLPGDQRDEESSTPDC